jgi:NifU-like protein involved in Fe-S cluster formation
MIGKNKIKADGVCGDGGFWEYSSILKEHFFRPRNMLKEDEDFEADGIGECDGVSCGDTMIFLIKIDKNKKIIKDCRWRTFGCASALASSSVLSEMILENGGMDIVKASKIKQEQIVERLGGLPDKKVKCAVLGHIALRDAIKDYEQKNQNK